eukprot:9195197-Pyramimonas_sp.AAC.1
MAADMPSLIGRVVSEGNPAGESSRKLWRVSRLSRRRAGPGVALSRGAPLQRGSGAGNTGGPWPC